MDEGGWLPLRILLDTGALYRPDVLRAARSERRRVVLPTIAYAERRLQLARDGLDPARLDNLLTQTGVRLEPFSEEHARRLPRGALDDARWQRHARDAMIAAHLGPTDELWTTNPSDFEALGVPRARLRAW